MWRGFALPRWVDPARQTCWGDGAGIPAVAGVKTAPGPTWAVPRRLKYSARNSAGVADAFAGDAPFGLVDVQPD